jgi:hypothetical protein
MFFDGIGALELESFHAQCQTAYKRHSIEVCYCLLQSWDVFILINCHTSALIIIYRS